MSEVILHHTVYAKIGELMQGKIAADKPFLITNLCSNHLYTTTTLLKNKTDTIDLRKKSYQALVHFLLFIEGHPLRDIKQKLLQLTDAEKSDKIKVYLKNISILQHSTIPKGKGLSSSSADILSTLLAVNNYLQTKINNASLYKIAASVEPTDACLSPPLLVFDQIEGSALEQLPAMDYDIIYFDSDIRSTVNTVSHTKSVTYCETDYGIYNSLLNQFKVAIQKKSYAHFFDLTLASALLNQKHLTHPKIDVLKSYAADRQIGLFIAHSGTYMGLILKPGQEEKLRAEATSFIRQNWNTPVYYQ